ncbi:MAG: DUF4870 domain-containing protein [Actinomycetales bacterium]
MSQNPHEAGQSPQTSGPDLSKPDQPGSAAPEHGNPTGTGFPNPGPAQPGVPNQPGYGSVPPQQPGYGGVPQQPGYGAPQQPGYGAAPGGGPGQGFGGPGYAPAPGYAPGGPALSGSDERTWATIGHAAGPVAALISAGTLGWLVPLVIFLMYKDRSQYVRVQASEALNFQITLLIAYLVCWVVTFLTFGLGFLLFFVPWVLSIIFGVMASIAVSRGENYRYPMTIRLVH